MSNQRSILSFFSGASSSQAKTTLPQATKQTPAASLPPPPPPPAARFVPPPPRNNYALPPGAAPTPAALPSPSPSPSPHALAPMPDLPAITPEQSRAILVQAGAELDGDDIVFYPSPSSLSARPSSCRILYPRAQDMSGLISVNAILLPIRYRDSFYQSIADPTRYACLFDRIIVDEDDKVVGGIVGRLEQSPFGSSPSQLAFYIQSLALSSPYRGSGLMAATLGSILRTIDVLNRRDSFGATVTSLYCHVWTENDDALRWYKANGFRFNTPEPVANYYFKLQPNTAWIVRRDVATPSVLEAVQAAAAAAAAGANQSGLSQDKKDETKAQGGRPQLGSSPSLSFQNSRPETEWNDLPADMVAASSANSIAASGPASAAGSVASSRNASRVNLAETPTDDTFLPPPSAGGSLKPSGTTRKKRERAYPAAMFQ